MLPKLDSSDTDLEKVGLKDSVLMKYFKLKSDINLLFLFIYYSVNYKGINKQIFVMLIESLFFPIC